MFHHLILICSPPIESSLLKTNGNRPDPPIGPIIVSSAGDNQVLLSFKFEKYI